MSPVVAELTPKLKSHASGLVLPDSLPYPANTALRSILINDAKLSANVIEACVDGEIIETMDGASTITLSLVDEKRTVVYSQLLKDWANTNDPPSYSVHRGRRVDHSVPSEWSDVFLTMDGRDYALVQVDKQGDNFDLQFENRAIYELRKIDSPRTWPRATFTRAEVIQAMCQEITKYPIGYYSPELRKKQPIASALSQVSTADRKKFKLHGFAPNAKVHVKHVLATSQQKSYIGRVLSTGESVAAPYIVLLAALETITQESGVTIVTNSSGHVGLFQQDPRYWPATGTNIEKDAHAFFTKAIEVYTQNPTFTAAQIALTTQGPGGSPQQYGQWEDEAKHTLKLWGSGNGSSNALYTEYQPYTFQRGQSGQREDSWTCGTRLASEVVWRLFAVDNFIVFMDDIELINQIPLDTISERNHGIDTIDFSIDTGKDVTQCTVTAHINRWQTPPGSVVVVEDSGNADGEWLVWEVRRPLFSSIAEITLQRPSPPKPEPAPNVITSASAPSAQGAKSGNKAVDKVYKKAVEISNRNLPYVWGGGHVIIGFPSNPSGGEIGYDCSGYVSACLHAAGWLDTPMTSGQLMTWGDSGVGRLLTVWTNPTHVFIHFQWSLPFLGNDPATLDQWIKDHPNVAFARADTVPDLAPFVGNDPSAISDVTYRPGPHVRRKWPGPEGNPPNEHGPMIPRHWPGT